MDETTQNFLQVFGNLPEWQLPKVHFRLYHDDQGRPIEYSQEDKPGNYIDISPEVFRDQPQNVRVVDGQLHYLESRQISRKIVPGTEVGVPCDPRDVCVVVRETLPHIKWSVKTYEPR